MSVRPNVRAHGDAKMTSICSVLWMTAALASTPPPERPQIVTPNALRPGKAKWRVVDYTLGGVSRIDRRVVNAENCRGALEQILPPPGLPEFNAEIELLSRDTVVDDIRGLYPARGGFGPADQLERLSFHWYRDSSSTVAPWFGAAIRVYIYDPDLGVNGSSYAMIWEPIYNQEATLPGPAVPTDTWIFSEIHEENFWRTPLYIDGLRAGASFCFENRSECLIYNWGIGDWGFGPRAVVFGLSISAGSGWIGTYRGYVDDFKMRIGDKTWAWDFGPRRRWFR